MAPDLQQLAEFALRLAREAGDLIRREREQAQFKQDYKGGRELVTSADLKADRLIRESIERAYPDHLILSEESSPLAQDPHSLRQPLWIIDPIDGTVNFAHGLPHVAICIAFALNGEVQVGVVHCPFSNETFHAIRGRYSRLNDQPIRVSGQEDFRRALVATGFPYDKSEIPQLARRVESVLTRCADIRRLGSAAVDICWVAMGRFDAFYESLSPWDFAAARLIAREAGARCGHLYAVPAEIPEDLYGRDILVSTPALYEHLEDALRQADAS